MKTILAILFPVVLFLLPETASGAFYKFYPPETQDAPAQETRSPNDRNEPAAHRSLKAERVEPGVITVDGILDEEAWRQASVATGFIQRSPETGDPATEDTEVYVLYTNEAIYIGARMYDSTPDSIAATLFRRDGTGYTDWFMVGLDSYNDRRTAFVFAVNPLGVRRDFLTHNGNQTDVSWDAVWQAAGVVDEHGWTAEIRIPLSQLRYNGEEIDEGRSWGINFRRDIARKGEEAFWAATPPETSNLVARYGRLTNLEDLPKTLRLEMMPYASGRLIRSHGNSADPFHSPLETGGNLGLDIKYGLNSNLTLTATINPDFGQVEVDPAVVNLSAFETFFQERRPFFQEGADIFNIGLTNRMINIGASPTIFYSRRIGRTPQGPFPGESVYTDRPQQTPIAGAAKLSGRIGNDWTVGVLNALTPEQRGDYWTSEDEIRTVPLEPLTNYFTGRVRRDFQEGQTVMGGMLNMVHRNLNHEPLQALLTDQAYSGALDFEHNWADQTFQIQGVLAGSRITGTPDVLGRIQRSSARYYQRPDAGHLDMNEAITSMEGIYADVMLSAQTRHWRGQINLSQVSPGFEVNDLGFQSNADRRALTGAGVYLQPSPQGIFQRYEGWVATSHLWNFGGEKVHTGIGTGTYFQFRNFWWLNTNIFANLRNYDDRLTRGGPLAREPSGVDAGFNVGTDSRKDLMVSTGAFHWVSELNENQQSYFLNVRYRPHPAANISIQPMLRPSYRTRQYVTRIEDAEAGHTFGSRYIFADLNQTTLSANIRLEWTFTPDLSLQLYAQPFVSAGRYSRFKEFSRPGAMDFDVYGEDKGSILYDEDTARYLINPEDGESGSAFELNDPDFNIRSLRGNAVLRWEFRPGSTVFLVWQQIRSDFADEGHFHFARDFGDLFRSPADHTLMLKVSYWWGT